AVFLSVVGQANPIPARTSERRFERQQGASEARILRVKPAVVRIFTEVSAEVTLRCGEGGTHVVTPDPSRESGTGFIIHPDGWIATNGHVVKPVHGSDDEHVAGFLRAAADKACGAELAQLPEKERTTRMQALLRDPANRAGVRLTKKLLVDLPHNLAEGQVAIPYPAAVKAYSPSIDPDRLPKDGGKPEPPMLDAALIKIEATQLPAVRLAPSIEYVHLGEELFVIGYPGVVLWHTYLSEASRTEASVTFGRVSSFKYDVNGRRILQTDAAISWGNSGGPAFNWNDRVIGVATFISTSLEGDQAIQGFNFLIPVDTIHDLARQVGVTPQSDGTFMLEWQAAVNAYFGGRFRTALAHAEAADAILPGLADVYRLRTHLQRLNEEHPWWDTELRVATGTFLTIAVVASAFVFFTVLGVRTIRKRRQKRKAA
ncbi:MAG: serine protease, partial [Zetaproteobacteria bacterium]